MDVVRGNRAGAEGCGCSRGRVEMLAMHARSYSCHRRQAQPAQASHTQTEMNVRRCDAYIIPVSLESKEKKSRRDVKIDEGNCRRILSGAGCLPVDS